MISISQKIIFKNSSSWIQQVLCAISGGFAQFGSEEFSNYSHFSFIFEHSLAPKMELSVKGDIRRIR